MSETASATAGPPASVRLQIAQTAGGMTRDLAKEQRLKAQLDAARQQFRAEARSVETIDAVVYQQDNPARGPVGSIVFLGANLAADQNPASFVNSFSAQAQSGGFRVKPLPTNIPGVTAVCAEQSGGQEVAICAWATARTMGEVVPTVPGWDAGNLGPLLLAVRADST